MEKEFAKRLRLARKSRGLSQKALGDLVGVSQANIQKLESAKSKSTSYAFQLAKALQVSPAWLISGDGEMGIGINNNSEIPPESEWGGVDAWDRNTPMPDDEVEIPYLRDIELAAGDGSINEMDYNGFKLRFSKSTLRKVGANSDGSGVICFPARGNSMEPNIPDGTTVAVNVNDKKIVDGKIYAINEKGWKRIKVLFRVGPDTISIRSYNAVEHPPEEKPIEDIEIIGRVFWYSVIV